MSNETISSSEFQRFQDQLISLKESKYKCEEKCEYLVRNLSQMESKCSGLERELMKANELKIKFKSAKDMDNLMNENQILRDRLSTIEHNFKLQNDVIRTECENLFSENERLKSQLETYKSTKTDTLIINNDTMDSPVHEDYQYKIRYLQHEVTKLLEEKNYIENENNNLKFEICRLKESEKELVLRINDLLNEKTKLVNQYSVIKEDNELCKGNHLIEMENRICQFEKQLELKTQEYNSKIEIFRKELEDDYMKKNEETLKVFQSQSEELEKNNVQLVLNMTKRNEEIEIINEDLKQSHLKEITELKSYYDKIVKEKQCEIFDLEEKYGIEIEELKNNNSNLQVNLDFTEEELKLSTRKNQKIMKDVKKQLEREVRLAQETQSKLEEVVSGSSQNSQSKLQEYLSGACSKFSNNDDQTSLYSSSNNGLDFQPPFSNSITMTDEELKNLLDRFTSIQNDFAESKRYIESLINDKAQLAKTIDKQQSIILKYIKNRGAHDPESELESPKHHHSTSEALILNGMMSSSHTSNFGLQSLVNKLKDTLKSISISDSFSGSDKSVCRVTVAEVKQLQRVCEELMMRCLNLETDLQFALDLNMHLQGSVSNLKEQ